MRHEIPLPSGGDAMRTQRGVLRVSLAGLCARLRARWTWKRLWVCAGGFSRLHLAAFVAGRGGLAFPARRRRAGRNGASARLRREGHARTIKPCVEIGFPVKRHLCRRLEARQAEPGAPVTNCSGFLVEIRSGSGFVKNVALSAARCVCFVMSFHAADTGATW